MTAKEHNACKLYDERIARVKGAIALKKPDRVPIVSPVQKFVYDHAGITMKQTMYHYDITRFLLTKWLPGSQSATITNLSASILRKSKRNAAFRPPPVSLHGRRSI